MNSNNGRRPMAERRRVTVLCSGADSRKADAGRETLTLDTRLGTANVYLEIEKFVEALAEDLSPIQLDLFDVAAYVYCADKAVPRGRLRTANLGKSWRRDFRFRIPVREPKVWNSKPIRQILADTLNLLSDDDFDFHFTKIRKPSRSSSYFLNLVHDAATVEHVLLFSGGLDSLAGAVKFAIADKAAVTLVSHHASGKILATQKALAAAIEGRAPHRPNHIPVCIKNAGVKARDSNQRCRTFLYASIAAVTADAQGLDRILVCENGPMSLHLHAPFPCVGSRATRTTHPGVLKRFAALYSHLFDRKFGVENPFLLSTKTECVRLLRENGCGELVRVSVSCTDTIHSEFDKPHCGTCSQCLDRRVACIVAGCTENEDPPERYRTVPFVGALEETRARTESQSYFDRFSRIRDMTDVEFAASHGEISRVLAAGMNVRDVVGLYRRQADDVVAAVERVFGEYVGRTHEDVPETSLLAVVMARMVKSRRADPLLRLVGLDHKEASFIAELLGSGKLSEVKRKLGPRQLLFLMLLFDSGDYEQHDGYEYTTVSRAAYVEEHAAWIESGWLKMQGADSEHPGHRIQKMWHEFVKQMTSTDKLQGLFHALGATAEHADTRYAIRLKPSQTVNEIKSLDRLFVGRRENPRV